MLRKSFKRSRVVYITSRIGFYQMFTSQNMLLTILNCFFEIFYAFVVFPVIQKPKKETSVTIGTIQSTMDESKSP